MMPRRDRNPDVSARAAGVFKLENVYVMVVARWCSKRWRSSAYLPTLTVLRPLDQRTDRNRTGRGRYCWPIGGALATAYPTSPSGPIRSRKTA